MGAVALKNDALVATLKLFRLALLDNTNSRHTGLAALARHSAGAAVLGVGVQIDASTVAVGLSIRTVFDNHALAVDAGFVCFAGCTAGSTVIGIGGENDAGAVAHGLALGACTHSSNTSLSIGTSWSARQRRRGRHSTLMKELGKKKLCAGTDLELHPLR